MSPQDLAHISEDGLREQTVAEHLLGTAELAAGFGSAFGAGEEARLAGLLHDIGKCSDAFQARLRGGPRCDHSTAGAQEAQRLGSPPVAFSVAGHHGGLPDGGARGDEAGSPTMMGRFQKKLDDYSRFAGQIELPDTPLPPPRLDGPSTTAFFRTAFYTRMLFSCLVDADWLDTEAFMDGAVERGMNRPIPELLERLDAFLRQKGWDRPVRELDILRRDILQQCRSLGALERGLFTLTVPTGGGKTGASMAFALEHAKAHRLRRIVYVIPYTSIIEQNAAIFRDMLGEDCVLEHHSGADPDTLDNADPASVRRKRAAENWDAAVIVTTAVQFFESLFAAKPSKCRKLHNLAESVIIFDEAQMLPVPYLKPCVAAMAELAARYGCSAVLCTATQPSLSPLLWQYAPSLPPRELCPNWAELLPMFWRVAFHQEGTLSDMSLAGRLCGEGQVLCIVNSRKQAQAAYALLNREGRYHLSTLMTPAHRREKLSEIRARLLQGLPCRVVSTSLIEAGVDVDFPAVYRAEAGLDSILQAAGRCNREGKRSPDDSIVHIFTPEGGSPPLFQPNIKAANSALRKTSPDDPAAIVKYFDTLYEWAGQALDHKNIMDQWERGSSGVQYPFQTIAEQFHLIEQPTTTVYIPTEESIPLLEELRQGQYSRRLFRRLGQHGVAVYPGHIEALDRGGHLERVDESTIILRSTDLYSQETGLTLEPVEGQALLV